MVTKNTLAKLAIKGTPYEVLAETLKGPIAIAFGFEDQVAPAKALSKFIKDTKKGEILAAAMDGNLLSAEEAKALATIPSKEEIYAKMLGCVNSPATGIVGSINAVMASLTRAVAAVRDQKSA
jgi:large subunit ribosomal protein L10